MDKKAYYLAGAIGTTVGGYLPTLFGAGALGGWSILGGAIGGIAAIFLLNKISQ